MGKTKDGTVATVLALGVVAKFVLALLVLPAAVLILLAVFGSEYVELLITVGFLGACAWFVYLGYKGRL